MKKQALELILISIVLILGFFLLLNCEDETTSESLKRQREIDAKLSALVSKYNANDTWIQELRQREHSNLPITTLHLQQAFSKTSSHPFLFEVVFDDLFKKGDQHFAAFITSIDFWRPIYFELSCAEEQIQRLLKIENSYGFPNLAIIATVDELQKLRFDFEAISSQYEEAYIEIDASQAFLIKGHLLDFCQLY